MRANLTVKTLHRVKNQSKNLISYIFDDFIHFNCHFFIYILLQGELYEVTDEEEIMII